MKSKYKLEDALKEALVTEELQKMFSDFDALCSREVAAVQQSYLSVGIVFGMKLSGASHETIHNAWRILKIGKERRKSNDNSTNQSRQESPAGMV